MMDNEIDRELLEKIADLIGKPVGAFNIRKDCGCDGRQSTEHIEITGKATMVIISHQERIISLADEVIVVGDGAIRRRGPAADILPQILADTLGGCPVLTKEVKA